MCPNDEQHYLDYKTSCESSAMPSVIKVTTRQLDAEWKAQQEAAAGSDTPAPYALPDRSIVHSAGVMNVRRVCA